MFLYFDKSVIFLLYWSYVLKFGGKYINTFQIFLFIFINFAEISSLSREIPHSVFPNIGGKPIAGADFAHKKNMML
ncbi:hypothetical protein DB48_17055 [Shewanella sp. cp20]|nr:hypothetical protein DB48_17055 [Shewanella sp. cp20]